MQDDLSGLGGRLPLLSKQELDQDQREIYEKMSAEVVPWAEAAGFKSRDEQGHMLGPFNPVLFSPKMWSSFLEMQTAEQKATSLSQRVRQIVILSVGSVWKAPYELYAHSAVALQAGLQPVQIQALTQGRTADDLRPEEVVAQRFTLQLVREHTVDDATFAEARHIFSYRGLVEIVLLAGCYLTVCASLRAFHIPVPDRENKE